MSSADITCWVGETLFVVSQKYISKAYTKDLIYARYMCQFWWIYRLLNENKTRMIYDIDMFVLKMTFHFALEAFSNYSKKLSVKIGCSFQDQDNYCSHIKYNVTLFNDYAKCSKG